MASTTSSKDSSTESSTQLPLKSASKTPEAAIGTRVTANAQACVTTTSTSHMMTLEMETTNSASNATQPASMDVSIGTIVMSSIIATLTAQLVTDQDMMTVPLASATPPLTAPEKKDAVHVTMDTLATLTTVNSLHVRTQAAGSASRTSTSTLV